MSLGIFGLKQAGGWMAVIAILLAMPLSAIAQTVIIDNENANNSAGNTFSMPVGTWSSSATSTDRYLTNYRFISSALGGTAQAEWRPTIPTAGDYEVSVWYPQGTNRASDAPYTVVHATGSTTIDVNQQAGGGVWNSLGTFTFAAGTAGYVRLGNDANPMVVMADAVRFERTGAGPVTPEWRAMWVSRFEWPSSNKTTVQNNLIDVMSKLVASNFNAVVLQVRGECDTLYPSPEEPWSPLMSGNGDMPSGWAGFDPLDFAIDQAHARNLEFHAYINTHVGWQSGSNLPPNYAPDHIWWQHLNASDPAHRDWLIHDSGGTPVGFEESDYTWMAPGVPDMQAYVRRQVMYVVENYDVDGIHYDRIRSPGTAYSYDPISQARRAGEGNPNSLAFADWTRDQINRFTQDLYAQIMEVKPWIKVSSAPLGLYLGTRYPGYPTSACGYQYGYSCVYQDAQAWLAAGSQDFICPQIYWADGGSNPDFSEVLPDWVAHNGGRHIYAGQITSVGVTALISQIGATRTLGGQGNVVFSFGSFNSGNFWSSYTGGPYPTAAPVPAMPWKDTPTDGILIGNVFEVDGVTPIVDAHITRTGSTYVSLSSGDGLYSFLKVPPGTYTLDFDKPGIGTRQVNNVSVVAGQVTRVDVLLGDVPCDYNNDGQVNVADLQQFSFCNQGPAVAIPGGSPCLKCDVDGNNRIDLVDFAEFTRRLNH
jgi:uncharacterized lipoprotein YddW (UPF0748 family)